MIRINEMQSGTTHEYDMNMIDTFAHENEYFIEMDMNNDIDGLKHTGQ